MVTVVVAVGGMPAGGSAGAIAAAGRGPADPPSLPNPPAPRQTDDPVHGRAALALHGRAGADDQHRRPALVGDGHDARGCEDGAVWREGTRDFDKLLPVEDAHLERMESEE